VCENINPDNYCSLKNCRLRTCTKELPEDERDYSEDYPLSVYGYECHVPCQIRQKKELVK
jgi:hypothetical protein